MLKNKAGKTDGENKYLQELLLKERKLIQLIPEDEDERELRLCRQTVMHCDMSDIKKRILCYCSKVSWT